MVSSSVPEGVFLKPLSKPKDLALINSDDWPIFALKKVKVVSQRTGELVSLLSAHKDNPVKVTGQLLEVDDVNQHLVRNQNYEKQWIELTDVTLYSFAEYLDGTYGFWAAGKSGWFEFDSVAPSYRQIHDQMSEATSWIYILADKINSQISKPPANVDGSKLEKYMQSVFSDYLSKAANPARFSDVVDVRQAFHEHRLFLITSMLESQVEVFWLDTPVFTYLKKHFPEDVASLTARIIPTAGGPTAGVPATKVEAMQDPKKRRSESPHIDDARAKKRKGRPSKESTPVQVKAPPKNPPPETPIPDEDDDDIILSTRKRKSYLRPSGATSAKKARITPSSFKDSSALEEDDDSDEGVVEKSTRSTRDSQVTTIKSGEHLDIITNPGMQPKDQESRDRSSPQYLPLKYLELSVAEYDIPSTQPQGPGGLWTCSFGDCRARVHQAGTESGQERVKEHLKTHIVKERIDLVMDESKPYLPINNLVRRLQAFAPPSGEGLPPDSIERTFSAPIRRRY